MTDIVTVASAVRDSLSAYHATLEYVPEFTLAESSTQKVVVIPSATQATMEARGLNSTVHTVQVALVRRVSEGCGVSDMVTLLQAIGGGMLGNQFGTFKCTGLSYPALYGAAELREKRLFVGIIELTLSGV